LAELALPKPTTGKRKTAVARIRMRPGTGAILVNGRTLDEYFGREVLRTVVKQPLDLVNQTTRWDIAASVHGGGPTGQAGALRHGIARALILIDASLRPQVKRGGFLTRDARKKERKKYGQRGARARFQFSKR
jgi:small subunit ribosomal protein S9